VKHIYYTSRYSWATRVQFLHSWADNKDYRIDFWTILSTAGNFLKFQLATIRAPYNKDYTIDFWETIIQTSSRRASSWCISQKSDPQLLYIVNLAAHWFFENCLPAATQGHTGCISVHMCIHMQAYICMCIYMYMHIPTKAPCPWASFMGEFLKSQLTATSTM